MVLAYSGGLDTSVILQWLIEEGFEVICYCGDVGQPVEASLKEKALKIGATKVYVEDLRHEFVTDYVFEAIKANAIYESRYLLGTSIARPCIAKRQVEIARKEGAKYIAHGATGKGNDQVRFELSAMALDATITTIAPWRIKKFLDRFKGRGDLINYATQHGIPVASTKKASYSIDENLYHTSFESGNLEDAMSPPEQSMFKMTVSPEQAPDKAEIIRIEFEGGVPTKVINYSENNTTLTDPLELFLYLNKIAGRNGVGRIDIVENRFVGIKSRGIYETPGGKILYDAHVDLEHLTLDRDILRIKRHLSDEWAQLCYNGFWFSPEMDFVRNSMSYANQHVSGAVKLSIYKGNVTVLGRESSKSLYCPDLASMEIDGGGARIDYDPSDAEGFIACNSTRLKAYSMYRGCPTTLKSNF